MTVQALVEPMSRSSLRLSWAVPLIPVAVAGFCLSALVYYHVQLGGAEGSAGILQGLVVGLYRSIGFAPALVLALLVLVWATIWYVGGVLEQPGQRVLRILALALSLAILVSLDPNPVANGASQGGVIGGFLAGRLQQALGYTMSTALVSIATLCSLLLATDFMFHRHFESLVSGSLGETSDEVGVEAEAVREMQALSLARSGVPEPVAAGAGLADAAPRSGVTVAAADAAQARDGASPTPVAPPARVRQRWTSRRAAPLSEASDDAEPRADSLTPPAIGDDRGDLRAAAPADGDESDDDEIAGREWIDDAELSSLDYDDDEEDPDREADADDASAASDVGDGGELSRGGAGVPRTDMNLAPWQSPAPALEDLPRADAAPVPPPALPDMAWPDPYAAGVGQHATGFESDADDAAEMVASDRIGAAEVGALFAETDAEEVVEAEDETDDPDDVSEAAPAGTLAELDDARSPAVVVPIVGGQDEQLVEIPRPAPGRQGSLFAPAATNDALLAEAAQLVTRSRRASIVFLQRRLRVGHEEARELLDALRRRGVVGGELGSSQGDVLVEPEAWGQTT